MPLRFTPEDHQRIASAITRAELRTGGEIHAVFARRSDDYRFVAATVALTLSLLLGWLAVLIAWLAQVRLPPLMIETAQVAGAAILFLCLRAPRLAIHFVPPDLARARAASFARAQFLAHNLHTTPDRTGVLLFVSEAERYAEVIADEAVAKAVSQEDWNEIVALLTQAARDDDLARGFEVAVARCADILAERFPPDPERPNVLPDRLVEI